MPQVTFEWKIVELLNSNDGSHITDKQGQKLCIVHESYHGTTEDPKEWGPMPCVVAENFVHIRRRQAYEEVTAEGGVFIFPQRTD